MYKRTETPLEAQIRMLVLAHLPPNPTLEIRFSMARAATEAIAKALGVALRADTVVEDYEGMTQVKAVPVFKVDPEWQPPKVNQPNETLAERQNHGTGQQQNTDASPEVHTPADDPQDL